LQHHHLKREISMKAKSNRSHNRLTVRVDWENNAESFWHDFAEQMPDVASRFRSSDEAELTIKEWDLVRAIPGFFTEGQPFAAHPIVLVGSEISAK
jgi:hypothetical protein